MSLRNFPTTIEENYDFAPEPSKSNFIQEDRAPRKRKITKRPSTVPASMHLSSASLESEKSFERPKTTDGRKRNITDKFAAENPVTAEASVSVYERDLSLSAIPCHVELIEAPKYLNERVVPAVMKAIEQLLIKLEGQDFKEDPVLFLAKQLKPSGQFRSKRVTDEEEEVKRKPKKAAPVFIPPDAIKKPKTPQEIRASLIHMGGKSVSEREISIAESFNGEFF